MRFVTVAFATRDEPIASRVGSSCESTIDFDWGTGTGPTGTSDDFSARWTKTVNVPTTGDYAVELGADDDARVGARGHRRGHGTLLRGGHDDRSLDAVDHVGYSLDPERRRRLNVDLPDSGAAAPGDFGTVEGLGLAIYQQALVPFEVISITLLVAIIGAIAIARSRTD